MASSLLSAEDAALWHAWKIATEAVMRKVGAELQTRARVSGADFGVLSRLVDLGQGTLRQQELADSMGWDKSRLSHHLSRMERRALVKRSRVGAQHVQITISELGRTTLDHARRVHAQAVRHHLVDVVPSSKRAWLLTTLTRLGELE